MIYAYDQLLLNKARTSCGWMFDYAVNDVKIELKEFYQQFLNSKICDRFQAGDSRTVAGMSGIEMAREVIAGDDEYDFPEPTFCLDRSPEYWLGWSISYYQWYKNCTFAQITERTKIEDILMMYKKYHEMDILQFVDALDEMRAADSEARLRRLRRYAGLSQSQLASRADVPVRSIQQYEQKQKDINKASLETVMKLSKALYCKPEDLMEI